MKCINCGNEKIYCKKLCNLCYYRQPRVKEKRRIYHKKLEVIARVKERNQKPERIKKIKEKNKDWYLRNKDTARYKKIRNDYIKNRIRADTTFKLLKITRTQVINKLKRNNNVKKQKTFKLIGCTINEYKEYLEKLFKSGMTWKNHGQGKGKWEIHHIKEVSTFNLKDDNEIKKAFNYKNTRPEWYEEHIALTAKFNKK